ncbi:hypothetical protein ACXZ9C_10960 [Streptococcus agalactiae]
MAWRCVALVASSSSRGVGRRRSVVGRLVGCGWCVALVVVVVVALVVGGRRRGSSLSLRWVAWWPLVSKSLVVGVAWRLVALVGVAWRGVRGVASYSRVVVWSRRRRRWRGVAWRWRCVVAWRRVVAVASSSRGVVALVGWSRSSWSVSLVRSASCIRWLSAWRWRRVVGELVVSSVHRRRWWRCVCVELRRRLVVRRWWRSLSWSSSWLSSSHRGVVV